MKVVLASASPRRLALLEQVGIKPRFALRTLMRKRAVPRLLKL